MKDKTKRRVNRSGLVVFGLAVCSLLFFALVPAPIDGFYFSRLFEVLDGSTSYVYLSEGRIYGVSCDDRGTVTWNLVGTYLPKDGKLLVTFSDFQNTSFWLTPGWFKLKWESKLYDHLLAGEPIHWNDNWRIWFSSAKMRMLSDENRPKHEQTSPSPSGAD